LNGVAVGGHNTDTALVLANDKASGALDKAQKNTGNALTKSYRNVVKALEAATKSTGKALGVEKSEETAPR
jgi:translation initiation factor 2 alpha subunit (eIF-2alpha)